MQCVILSVGFTLFFHSCSDAIVILVSLQEAQPKAEEAEEEEVDDEDEGDDEGEEEEDDD